MEYSKFIVKSIHIKQMHVLYICFYFPDRFMLFTFSSFSFESFLIKNNINRHLLDPYLSYICIKKTKTKTKLLVESNES